MKKGSTHFLRFTLFIIGLAVLALCIFGLPSMWKGASAEYPTVAYAVTGIVIFLYATVIPFYIALWQALKLLSYIDKRMAFSDLSMKALKNIKYCAVAISVLYFMIEPFMFIIADADDAPGLIIIWGAIACAPLVVAVFAAVLQKHLQGAMDIKSENDLTV